MHFISSLAALSAALLPFYATAAPTPLGDNLISIARAGEAVSDNYIVVFKDDTADDVITAHIATTNHLHRNRLVRRDDASLVGLKKQYAIGGFKAYSGAFDSSTIDQIKNSTEVDFVEEDQIMVAKSLLTQTKVPSWGIARISQKSGKNASLTNYFYDSSAGEGVTAYVIDTGINVDHVEFEGRATWGFNSADDKNEDGVGHGTHVAGTIGSVTYGVAKGVSLVAVKVLGSDGSGTNAGVIEGVEWVTSDAKSKGKSDKSVANMSLGGTVSAALNKAVAAAVDSGVTFVVAAGNENVDASNSSPASEKSAITVGATQIGDARAEYSNFGSFVDVFAPGTDIVSTWIGSTTAVNTISGTSMASPHVAGLAAYAIAAKGLSGSTEVTDWIKKNAIKGVVTDAGANSPNTLIYNGSGK
ncbi:uncharacterized protein LAJ45_01492 [Morchella importuna]|uniref:Alkaline serine protease Alp1 n=1 Tax=Morchella conica CCBAS932 TaxID=1392247 RepID=A0A3N4KCM1_9PEZI|nr:uncharacterized protein LAJ45_01492 [Morchella importuna]KAH8154959.1 hypothetical protein LAJ45_01492 [Morchella importuna]RPB08240.1 alkaline serine protease Alp1 [Morchella conica CCBAS932]